MAAEIADLVQEVISSRPVNTRRRAKVDSLRQFHRDTVENRVVWQRQFDRDQRRYPCENPACGNPYRIQQLVAVGRRPFILLMCPHCAPAAERVVHQQNVRLLTIQIISALSLAAWIFSGGLR